jgi:hypothetical protein
MKTFIRISILFLKNILFNQSAIIILTANNKNVSIGKRTELKADNIYLEHCDKKYSKHGSLTI